MSKYLPTDVSTFSTMITGNYTYVDKTKYIYELFSKGQRYYFLSRPRRFGKSLLVSTLKEFFSGNKELFNGLWISTSKHDWQKHPVIYLDFSAMDHDTIDELKASVTWTLNNIAQEWSVDISQAPTPGTKLIMLIQQLAKINKVVILIDEYDKPLLDHLHDLKKAKENRNFLRSFYDRLKGMDAYLRAIFITGVSKFSRTSLFSGLNNLKDISNTPKESTLLGYTQQELEQYFLKDIERLAKKNKTTAQNMLEQIKTWYNGYRFSRDKSTVYNPYSVLLYLSTGSFENYWFETGTPFFLVNVLRQKYKSLENITTGKVSVSSLGAFNIENIPLITILFQTGYLTITDYVATTRKYKLGFPNEEVRISFEKQ